MATEAGAWPKRMSARRTRGPVRAIAGQAPILMGMPMTVRRGIAATVLLLSGGCAIAKLPMSPVGWARSRGRDLARHMVSAEAHLAKRAIADWPVDQEPGWMNTRDECCVINIRKDWNMWKVSTRMLVIPTAGLCMAAGGCSQWMHAMVHRDSQTVAAITQNAPPGGRVAKDPAVVILRPAIQAAAQAAGPMGGEALGIVAAIASLIAGATTTVAARSRAQLSQHKQAISELARAVAPGTILHPATQRVVTAATS